jgi:hypothetical protein
MPRLSDYIAAAAAQARLETGGDATAAAAAAPAPNEAGKKSPQTQPLATQQPLTTLPASPTPPPPPPSKEALERLARAHARRVRDAGERRYRHGDGSLRSTPPPREPFTVVCVLFLLFRGVAFWVVCLLLLVGRLCLLLISNTPHPQHKHPQ